MLSLLPFLIPMFLVLVFMLGLCEPELRVLWGGLTRTFRRRNKKSKKCKKDEHAWWLLDGRARPDCLKCGELRDGDRVIPLHLTDADARFFRKEWNSGQPESLRIQQAKSRGELDKMAQEILQDVAEAKKPRCSHDSISFHTVTEQSSSVPIATHCVCDDCGKELKTKKSKQQNLPDLPEGPAPGLLFRLKNLYIGIAHSRSTRSRVIS